VEAAQKSSPIKAVGPRLLAPSESLI